MMEGGKIFHFRRGYGRTVLSACGDRERNREPSKGAPEAVFRSLQPIMRTPFFCNPPSYRVLVYLRILSIPENSTCMGMVRGAIHRRECQDCVEYGLLVRVGDEALFVELWKPRLAS